MMKFDKPTLVTVTAPTCSGKTFLVDAMTKDQRWNPDPAKPFTPLFSRIVSTTTRAPRQGEVEGFDYRFITVEQSKEMEANGEFAELIEFRGTRYGVTHVEMENKLKGELSPIIILEPQGLKIYEKMCEDHGWGIFKIFVYTTEEVRIARLNERTAIDVRNAVHDAYEGSPQGVIYHMPALEAAEKLIKAHTSRLLSITGEERNWERSNTWNQVVPGDDVPTAIKMISDGVAWRNHQNRAARIVELPQPVLYNAWGADGEHP